MAQMIGDMVSDLGPASQPKIRPIALPSHKAAAVSTEASPALEHELQQAKISSETTTRPLLAQNEILEHQDFHFHGNNPWEDQSLSVLCSSEKFEINVRSLLPVQLWTLRTAEGSFIASGRTPDLRAFYFLIEEAYQPPYLLELFVNDQDQFYKVKLLLE